MQHIAKPDLASPFLKALLLALLVGGLVAERTASRSQAATAQTQSAEQLSHSRLHQISIALLEYISDNDNHFPPMASDAALQSALQPYLRGDPQSGKLYTQPGTAMRYTLNTGLSTAKLAVGAPWVILMYEPVPAADGSRLALYGRMQITPANEANPPEFLISKVERMSRARFHSLLSTKIQTVSP